MLTNCTLSAAAMYTATGGAAPAPAPSGGGDDDGTDDGVSDESENDAFDTNN